VSFSRARRLHWHAGRSAIALVCLTAILHAEEPPRLQTRVLTIHGETLERGNLVAVDDRQAEFTSGGSVPIDDVRFIELSTSQTPGRPVASKVVVHLAGGGQLKGNSATLDDDACTVTLTSGDAVSLSMDDLAAIRWAALENDVLWREALDQPSDEHDLIVLRSDQAATTVRGYVEALTADSLVFDWDKQIRTVALSQVLGIVLARSRTSAADARVNIRTDDGSEIPVTGMRRSEGQVEWTCELASGGKLPLPDSALQSLAVHSRRVLYVSGLKPIAVHERAIAALPRSWQADRNVRGESLRAGERIWERGLGMQSGASLVFSLDQSAETFVSLLSVDPPPGSSGDCEFVVRGDGIELARRRMRSGDPPYQLRLPVPDVRQLELRVDYGEGLDLGDHANWCDAHLVLAATK
jgi:hypothetical protein